jgi:hypothetical protein
MRHICEGIDHHGRYGYVLASPAGVRLYARFGFKPVGQVDTPYGPITSMLRQPQATFSPETNNVVDVSELTPSGGSADLYDGPSLSFDESDTVASRVPEESVDDLR